MTIVRREEVINSWSILIGGGQGRIEEIFGNTDNFITQTKALKRQEGKEKAGPGDNPGPFWFKGVFPECGL